MVPTILGITAKDKKKQEIQKKIQRQRIRRFSLLGNKIRRKGGRDEKTKQ
jgi:hypothetical protein